VPYFLRTRDVSEPVPVAVIPNKIRGFFFSKIKKLPVPVAVIPKKNRGFFFQRGRRTRPRRNRNYLNEFADFFFREVGEPVPVAIVST
jgi:hypothetical protein